MLYIDFTTSLSQTPNTLSLAVLTQLVLRALDTARLAVRHVPALVLVVEATSVH